MPTLQAYKGTQIVTPTPTGDGGAALNGNFIFCADKIEAHDAHVAATNNPHGTTAAQVGAYTSGAVDALLGGKMNTGAAIADGQLSSNVPLKNAANTFSVGGQAINLAAAGSALTLKMNASGSGNDAILDVRDKDNNQLVALRQFNSLFTGGIRVMQTLTAGAEKLSLRADSLALQISNDAAVKFSSTTSAPGTPDVGLVRSTSGVLQVTDGSTGDGALRVGNGIKMGSTADAGIARAAAGVVEINTGTAGTLRDLRCRNIQISTSFSGTTLDTVVGGFPIYNSAGTLLGYVPIYNNIEP